MDTRRNAARLLFPYYQKHFRTKFLQGEGYLDFRGNIGVPNNYLFLLNDPEFETLLVEAIRGRDNFIRDYERTIGQIELCLKQISRYLTKI